MSPLNLLTVFFIESQFYCVHVRNIFYDFVYVLFFLHLSELKIRVDSEIVLLYITHESADFYWPL